MIGTDRPKRSDWTTLHIFKRFKPGETRQYWYNYMGGSSQLIKKVSYLRYGKVNGCHVYKINFIDKLKHYD